MPDPAIGKETPLITPKEALRIVLKCVKYCVDFIDLSPASRLPLTRAGCSVPTSVPSGGWPALTRSKAGAGYIASL